MLKGVKRVMKLSVIIPVYNGEDVIKAAISSILEQSFKDFELLVIDGLSSDSTAEVVKYFKKIDNRVSLISEKDEGIYDAMNKGIRLAKGEWLYFMGSDDELYHSKVLEEMFTDPELLKNDLIYGNVKIRDTEIVYNYKYDLFKLFYTNICHQAIFTKKAVFEKIGPFNTKFKQLADWDFNIQCWLDPAVKKEYVPILVALYNNQGTSQQIRDEVFFQYKKEFLKGRTFTYPHRLRRKMRQLLNKLLPLVQ